jgi:uncharacterized membrane protein
MIKKEKALKINVIVLLLAGLMDLRRGIAHTFNVRYSAENLAGIELIPDSLYLMGAFGISNFLTGLLYLLVIWKAKNLVPYILLIIPISYTIGGLGIAYQKVQPDSAFIGQQIMFVYLSICLIASLIYFLAKRDPKNSTDNS